MSKQQTALKLLLGLSTLPYRPQNMGHSKPSNEFGRERLLNLSSQNFTSSRFLGLRSYTLMLVSFVLGVATAISQDRFYMTLRNKNILATSLSFNWINGITTGFIFFFKTCMTTAIGCAFCQAFWYVVQARAIRLDAIDCMFLVLNNPLKFFNFQFLLKAKVIVFMAIICWLIPPAVVFIPNSFAGSFYNLARTKITTVVSTFVNDVISQSVPTLSSLNADVGFLYWDHENVGLQGSTQVVRRIVSEVLENGQIITWPSQCGPNCTYTVTFTGPGLKCREISEFPSGLSGINSYPQSPYEQGPFEVAYMAVGRYLDNSVWSGSLESQGIYIYYSPIHDERQGTNHTLLCQLYQSNYTCSIKYLNYLQSFVDISVVNQAQISPRGDPYYAVQNWTLLNYFAIAEAVGEALTGYIQVYVGTPMVVDTLITLSKWVNISDTSQESSVNFTMDLGRKVEELLTNTTLSLLSFISNPPPGNLPNPAIMTSTLVQPAHNLVSVTLYGYDRILFWTIYGSIIGLTLLCVAIGCYVLYRNGIDGDLSFTQILVSTRNPNLDTLCYEAGFDGRHIPKELFKLSLQYGELESEHEKYPDRKRPVGFGRTDEVSPLKRRETSCS